MPCSSWWTCRGALTDQGHRTYAARSSGSGSGFQDGCDGIALRIVEEAGGGGDVVDIGRGAE